MENTLEVPTQQMIDKLTSEIEAQMGIKIRKQSPKKIRELVKRNKSWNSNFGKTTRVIEPDYLNY